MDNVITLGKLIGLLLFCPPPLHFVFENSNNTRNELARPVMGTIFLVYVCVCLYVYRMLKCVGEITWPKHAHAQSKFVVVKTDL